MPHVKRNAQRLLVFTPAMVLVAGLLGGGCAASSQMTNQWHDASLTPGSVHNILVVAIRKDPVRRRVWEDAYVGELAARGIAATASYRRFEAASPDTQQVIDLVRKESFDAVLTSARLPDEETTRYVPGMVRPERIRAYDYYGRFHNSWVSVQDPGYTETDTIMRMQTDLWSAATKGGRLVWSGTLRTLESSGPSTAQQAVSRHIMPELQKQGWVPAKSR